MLSLPLSVMMPLLQDAGIRGKSAAKLIEYQKNANLVKKYLEHWRKNKIVLDIEKRNKSHEAKGLVSTIAKLRMHVDTMAVETVLQ